MNLVVCNLSLPKPYTLLIYLLVFFFNKVLWNNPWVIKPIAIITCSWTLSQINNMTSIALFIMKSLHDFTYLGQSCVLFICRPKLKKVDWLTYMLVRAFWSYFTTVLYLIVLFTIIEQSLSFIIWYFFWFTRTENCKKSPYQP